MDTIKAMGARASMVMTLAAVSLLVGVGAASAAADPVADAFTTLEGKVTTYGAAVVALVVSVVVLFFGIKFLRRGAAKA